MTCRMADFLPAEHWKEDASGRKHTRPPPHKDASWNFLRGAGPSAAAEVRPFFCFPVLHVPASLVSAAADVLQGETLTTTNKAAFRPGWQEHRHEAKIQPSKERLAYERIQVCQPLTPAADKATLPFILSFTSDPCMYAGGQTPNSCRGA